MFWMAPEVHNWVESSFASDIFSLHVVLWEVRVSEVLVELS